MESGGWYLNLEKNGSWELIHFAEHAAVHPTVVQRRLFSKTFNNNTIPTTTLTTPAPTPPKKNNNQKTNQPTKTTTKTHKTKTINN